MNEWLYKLTLLTTFICLAFSLWFALFLLSRSRANPVTFRAVTILAALSIYFIYLLNALASGTSGDYSVRLFAMTIALIASHDLTYYLLDSQQRTKRYWLARGIILAGIIIVLMIFTASKIRTCDPTTLCPTELEFPYLIVEIFNAFVFCAILSNLWLIRKSGGMLNNLAFYLAILIGVGAVIFNFGGTALSIPMPRLLPNLLILTALVLLAYSVVRDRTFITQRTSMYDLPVSLLTIVVIAAIYILTGRHLKFPGTDIIVIAILAVFTHSAYDFVRDLLDQLVHRHQHRMRKEMELLGRDVSTNASLHRYLNRSLVILCKNLNTLSGFIAIRQNEHYTVLASYHSLRIGELFSASEVSIEGCTQPSSTVFPKIDWLAPGFTGSEQVVIIGVGQRKDKAPYDEEDLSWIEDIAHEISQIVFIHLQKGIHPSLESQVVDEIPGGEASQPIDQGGLLSALAYKPEQELIKWVEDGYQHLSDFDQLGRSPLVEFFGVKSDDHLENGKLVHDKLRMMLEKLRPAGQYPKEPIPRQWYAYTILYDSYVDNHLSRDIMSKLYIGEGTYYRIRRQAIRGIARAVQEQSGRY